MKPLLLTANGTGIADPAGFGFPADIGRAFAFDPWAAVAAKLDGQFYDTEVEWQGCWYPAAVFPMAPSVAALRQEVKRQIQARPAGTPLFLSGYSQSAIAMGQVWAQDILAPAGELHDRLPDVLGIIQFGDPVRCPGIANGNLVAGLPLPRQLDGFTTGGIAGPQCLTPEQTPDFYLSCALDGDLYASAPVGDDPWNDEPLVGQIETAIYSFVQTSDVGEGLLVIAERIANFFEHPLTSIIAHIEAIWNGLQFAAQGPAAPHWQYGPFVPAMTEWIKERINTRVAA